MRKTKLSDTAPKLFLVKPPQPEPSAELVEEVLTFLIHTELMQFAMELSIARTVWRKYRAMVETPDFPELLRKHYVEEWGDEPDHENVDARFDVVACLKANAITPEVREQLLPMAREKAQQWLAKEQAG